MDCGRHEAIVEDHRGVKPLPAGVSGGEFVGLCAGRGDIFAGGEMENVITQVAVESERYGLPSRVGQLQLGDHESHEIFPAGVVPVAGDHAEFLEEPSTPTTGCSQQLIATV